MKTYITDSKHLSKTNQFVFANKLYDYRIQDTEEGKIIVPQIYKRIFNKDIEGILCPSNYHLIYDILSINPNANFYNSFDFKWTDKPIKIDQEKNKQLMINYIKRSYISYLVSKELSSMGLKRIEQYIILSIISLLKNQKNLTVETFELIKEEPLKDIHSMYFIHYVAKQENKSIKEILKQMLVEYGKGYSTSPFVPLILKEKHTFYKYYEKLKKTTKTIKTFLINNKEVIHISDDPVIAEYLNTPTTIFKKQIIQKEKKPTLPLIYLYSKDIFPYRDMLLTITLLFQMKFLNEDLSLNFNEEKLQVLYNLEWLDSNLWKKVYDNLDFNFGHIFSSLNIKEKGFRCPVCNSRSYHILPLRIQCANCKFSINRYLPQHFKLEKLTIEEVISLLNNKTILKKNKLDNTLSIGFKKLNENLYGLEVLNF